MKRITSLLVFSMLLPFFALCQVGIGTITPNAQLDIQASNPAAPLATDGILIPKVDEFPATNPTAAQDGMLLFATGNGSVAKGFYYWNDTLSNWELFTTGSDEADWYEEGSTTKPDDIADDIYTMGNVAIGKNTADYPIEIFQASSTNTSRGIYNNTEISGNGGIRGLHNRITGNGSSSGLIYGVYNEFNYVGSASQTGYYSMFMNDSQGSEYGVFTLINNDGNGSKSGTYTAIYSDGSGHFSGTRNILSGNNNGFKRGVHNTLNGTGEQIGLLNEISGTSSDNKLGSLNKLDGTGNGLDFGIYNTLEGTGTGEKTGIYNLHLNNGDAPNKGVHNRMMGAGNGSQIGIYTDIQNTGSGGHFGMWNSIIGDGDGIKYGSHNTISGAGNGGTFGTSNSVFVDGTGPHYGNYNNIGGAGTGLHYGSYNSIHGSGSGNQFGVSSLINNSGSGSHYGAANSLVGWGAGNHYGISNSLAGTGTGNQYGVENSITNTGNGVHYGTYNSLSGLGAGDQYGTYNTISNTSNASHLGTYNFLNGTGTGNKYGTYTTVSATAGGTHYGIYSEVLKTGSFAGYFLGDVSVTNGTLEVNDTAAAAIKVLAANANLSSLELFEAGDFGYEFQYDGATDKLHLWSRTFAGNEGIRMTWLKNGNVGIGTTTPGYTLDVTGDINTTGNIRQSGGAYSFPDYVFETYFDGTSTFNPNYTLQSLSEVEVFLKENKHLPGVQSRADVTKNGWNVSENVRSNLEKIEELYLYSIEADKKFKLLEQKNQNLQKQLEQQKQEIQAIKALLKQQ